MSDNDQVRNWQKGLQKNHIELSKGEFSRTKSKKLIASKLYLNLQRALSPQENYFLGNGSLFRNNDDSYNRQIFDLFQDYIVVDKNRIPENFVKLFELDLKSPDVENQAKNIFKRARLLDKKSGRIVFIDDKIVIFRNEEILVHKESDGLTQAEKRRSEFVTRFNTFSNIYDAIRSQYYVIKGSQERQDSMQEYQKELLELAQKVRFFGIEENVKNGEWTRRLNYIIDDTRNARNFKVLAANLQNLRQLTSNNKIINQKLLEGAKNKFENRFDELQDMIGTVTKQLNDLENILVEHESLLESFLNQIEFLVDKSLALENYKRGYSELKRKYGDISPFCTFNAWIEKYQNDKDNFYKIMVAIHRLWNDYRVEHESKIRSEDVLFEGFDETKDNLRIIEGKIISSDDSTTSSKKDKTGGRRYDGIMGSLFSL